VGVDAPGTRSLPAEGDAARNYMATKGRRLPLQAALAAYTSGGAWRAFEEDSAGTITVGKRADLALLDADVPALDGSELAGVPVTGTWLAGVKVFG
jgi:predicted amidohydrolase YtcJ